MRLDQDFNVYHCVIPLQVLEENICDFVKNELKMIQRCLSYDFPEWSEIPEDEELKGSREAFRKITANFLKRMKQEGLADHLQSGEEIALRFLDFFYIYLCFFRNSFGFSHLSRKPCCSLSASTQIYLEDKVPESV